MKVIIRAENEYGETKQQCIDIAELIEKVLSNYIPDDDDLLELLQDLEFYISIEQTIHPEWI